VTIVHHVGKAPRSDRLARQQAYAKLQYARKNLGAVRRAPFVAALCLSEFLRAALLPSRERRRQHRGALRVVLGLDRPPFGEPPATALPAHSAAGRATEIDPAAPAGLAVR
jgi:hypothetical protein